MIAYGLHIGTRVEMSTLGETNNAQFLNLKVVRFIATRTAASVNRQYYSVRILWFTNLQRPLAGAETLLKNWRIEEPEF